MKSAVAVLSLVLYSNAALGAGQSDKSDRHHIVSAIDVSWINANSDLPSWFEGGNGKLRYDSDHDGLRVN